MIGMSAFEMVASRRYGRSARVARAFEFKEGNMRIDWAAVNWVYVALLSGFAFLGSLIGNLLSFRSRLVGSILCAVLFAVM
jgi:hypothetical protein